MYLPVCSSAAYSRLESSGVITKLFETMDKWNETILNGPFSNSALETYRAIDQKAGMVSDIERRVLEVSRVAEKARDSQLIGESKYDFLMENPVLLGYLGTGNLLERFGEAGFNSMREMEEAVASVCIGDSAYFSNRDSNFVWRSGNYRNGLSNFNQGDLSVSQTDVSFPEIWKKGAERRGFSGGQYGWGPFLITILRYAEATGNLGIPQIAQWTKYAGDASNPWGTINVDCDHRLDMHLQIAFDSRILDDSATVERLPLGIGNVYSYLKNNELLFVRFNWDGELELRKNLIGKRNANVITRFNERDIPHLMDGIYRLYARNRDEVPAIMKKFFGEK